MLTAHALKYRRITIEALRRAMRLTGHCARCGSATQNVAFWDGGHYAEECTACAAQAGRNLNDDAR